MSARHVRKMLLVLNATGLSLVHPAGLMAQARTDSVPVGTASGPVVSPVGVLIAQARSALGDLNYADAIELGHEALIQKRVRVPQQVIINQLLGAAFFPDPSESKTAAQPDSAIFYLRRAVRLQPDAALPEDMRWRGLDSLFQSVRRATFAAVARPAPDNALTGIDGRAFIDVVVTRPAKIQLQAVHRRSGTVVVHDSSGGSTRARLAMRAHDGERALFATGDYELQVIVRDISTQDLDTLKFEAEASGIPPVLDPVPVFPASAIRPERASRTIARGIVGGLMLGGITVALSRYARAEEPLRSATTVDGRAVGIAGVIAVGAIAGGVLDKGRPLKDNVSNNAAVRAEHARNVAAVETGNRRKVSEYKVELRIETEALR
jgi:hypothetical protein